MASLIEELISTLEQEKDIYEALVPISERKTRVIIESDLDALQSITAQEQEAVDRINALEHKRAGVIVNIGTVLNRNPGSLSLTNLVKLLDKQPEEQKVLSELHYNLKETIQRLVDINNQNKSLIEQSLEMIEFNMNFIQSTRMSPGNNNYTKSAVTMDTPAEQPKMFDAKQ